MLGKRAQPMIGKISKLLVSSNHAVFLDVSMTPRSTLDLKINSPTPRPKKSFDTNTNGVGLGILAALEKSEENRSSEILARHAMSSPRPILTDPINCGRVQACYEDSEPDSFESSNYLTRERPENEPFTRSNGNDFDKKITKKQSIFSVSICQDDDDTTYTDFPVSDFLSKCNLCKKKLHGKDIYMYRGEKAFCSADCRERYIIIEDRKEQWRSEAARSVDVSSYGQENVYSTGILAI